MKISTIASISFTALVAAKAGAFKFNPNDSSSQKKNLDPTYLKSRFKALHANNKSNDLSDFLGNSNDPDAVEAFKDILNDDMDSLKKRLEKGLNPDIRFFGGQTILHLISLKGEKKYLEDAQYLPVVKQLWLSGGDLDAKDDKGNTILDVLGNNQGWGLGDSVNQIKNTEMNVSFTQKELDAHLTVLSLQKEPTVKGKQWAVSLVKGGANTEVKTADGKRVSDNIRSNWSKENSKAFSNVVVAAKLKSSANKLEKILAKPFINDKWNNAVLSFYKAKGHE